MKLLGRDSLLKAFKAKTEDVETDAGTVRVSQIGVLGNMELFNRLSKDSDNIRNIDLDAELLVLSIIDEKGKPILTHDDIASLHSGDTILYNQLRTVARRLNGFDVVPEKNSETSQEDGSASSSQEN